ncbi:hypothetical protein CDD83_402 [Cordyceps sp. RAO-2017]|nr:hypothetical protein CDD83_402 [Cordyceps sp. RAO-2017]
MAPVNHDASRLDQPGSHLCSPAPEKPGVHWGLHWKSPAIMALLFLVGIAASISHHFFNQSLDGTIVTSSTQQFWSIRIGTGLAFLVKASLAASIGVACTQHLWVAASRQAMTVNSIDGMFSLTSNPLAFFDLKLLLRAKILVLLALVMW